MNPPIVATEALFIAVKPAETSAASFASIYPSKIVEPLLASLMLILAASMPRRVAISFKMA